jgi:hypothetical protein
LLHKQAELGDLEGKLSAIDEEETRQVYLRSWLLDANSRRKELVQEIDKKLAEYGGWQQFRSSINGKRLTLGHYYQISS